MEEWHTVHYGSCPQDTRRPSAQPPISDRHKIQFRGIQVTLFCATLQKCTTTYDYRMLFFTIECLLLSKLAIYQIISAFSFMSVHEWHPDKTTADQSFQVLNSQVSTLLAGGEYDKIFHWSVIGSLHCDIKEAPVAITLQHPDGHCGLWMIL
jgi:hypothetical protein